MKPLYEEHNRPIRGVLRFLGFVLLPIGAIFALIGFVDFFSAFGGGGPPTKFWCAFVGLPLVAAGVACLKAGYIRTIGKYVAGEGVPIVTESARYAARELRPTFKERVQDLKSAKDDGTDDPVERMKKLEELKKSGLISESEYKAKRSEIIQKL
jgi:hypothetical protein